MAKKKIVRTKSTKKSLKKDFRTTEQVWNRITILANEYAGGNRSLWLNHAAVNAPRKYLVKRK